MSDKTLSEADVITDHAPTKKLSCLEAMKERYGAIVCFTPALLVTHGHMPIDPVGEFVARFNVPPDGYPFCVELKPPTLPFFTGLGVTTHNGEVVDWDRRLYAVPQPYADNCLNFMGGIGIKSGDFFASAVTYRLHIPDPTMPQFNTVPHLIPTIIFGVLIDGMITYLETNGVMPPFVKTIAANTALQNSSGFKPSALTQTDFEKLKE